MLTIIRIQLRDRRARRTHRKIVREWGGWLVRVDTDINGRRIACLQGDIEVAYDARGICLDRDLARSAQRQRERVADAAYWNLPRTR